MLSALLLATLALCGASWLGGFAAAEPLSGPLCGPGGTALQRCRLCSELLSQFDVGECCDEPEVGALCLSFLDTLSTGSQQYPKPAIGGMHGAGAAGLFKRARNTFLGKRFSPHEAAGEDDLQSDGMEGVAEKRQRNNFLGKRVARSVDGAGPSHRAGPQRRGARGDARMARLIKAFVNQLSEELLEETGEFEASRASVMGREEPSKMAEGKAELEGSEEKGGSGRGGKEQEMKREQRAKNTFLGKRSVA